MDVSLIPAGVKPSYTSVAPSAPKSSAPVRIPVSAPSQQLSAKTVDTLVDNKDAYRKEVVQRAAQALAENSYPVSDKKFTIYKDSGSGQYITRFTDLKDGKVTYYPEQTMFAYFQGIGNGSKLVNIKA